MTVEGTSAVTKCGHFGSGRSIPEPLLELFTLSRAGKTVGGGHWPGAKQSREGAKQGGEAKKGCGSGTENTCWILLLPAAASLPTYSPWMC